ncbi:MAG: hypothetical protein ABS917_11250 [Solibacillus sp.]|uniref:hypothetical protein n=1 Tax=Solibacillus sp. TaxID=1909654 RepID=UPI003314DF1D
MIIVGTEVRIKEEQKWFAEEFNLTLGKVYKVVKTNKFWCTATLENDLGKLMGVDTERLELVKNS